MVVQHATAANATFVTSTDGSGVYRVNTLRPGSYRVRAHKPGFLMNGQLSADVLHESLTADVAPGLPTTRDVPMVRGAAIEGRFVKSTGEPLEGAQFNLTIERLTSGPNGESVTGSTRVSIDGGGRFRFHTLGAGRFILRANLGATKPEWYYPGTAERQSAQVFSLSTGTNLAVSDFPLPEGIELPPFTPLFGQAPAGAGVGAIEGRVFDEFGDPAPWISVQLLERRFMAGRFRLLPRGYVGGTVYAPVASRTDDLGQFRLRGLAEGDYYIVALAEPFGRNEHPADQDELTGLAPTYFPNTEDPAQAKPIRVVNGQVTSDVLIGMQSTATGSLVVKRFDSEGRQRTYEGLTSLDTLFQIQHGEIQPAIHARLRTNDAVNHLPSGQYVLWSGGDSHSVLVTPGSTNVLPVTERPVYEDRLDGRVSFDGASAGLLPSEVAIHIEHTDIGRRLAFNPRTGTVLNDNWTFWTNFRIATTGVFRVIAPSGWALARVSTSERDITDTPTPFVGQMRVDVVLTNRTGKVSGRVLDGSAPTNRRGVILFAEDRERWTYPSRFIHVAHVNAQGQFEIAGILPGKYLALALPNNTDEGADPEWLDAMRSAAIAVVIAEGRTATVDVQAPR